MRKSDIAALAVFVALCFAVAAVGGAVTATSVGIWYGQLAKPAFNPPDWMFGPVWTVLYLLMAIAAWRVWCRRGRTHGAGLALGAWAVQLALNLCWSFLFFGARMIGAALAEIVVLLAAILVTTGLLEEVTISQWLLADSFWLVHHFGFPSTRRLMMLQTTIRYRPFAICY